MQAQFPAACIENDQLMARCCPSPDGTDLECGGGGEEEWGGRGFLCPSVADHLCFVDRGECVEIFVHNNWPWKYFNNACVPGGDNDFVLSVLHFQ